MIPSKKFNFFIWPIHWTLTDATTPGQGGLEWNGNEDALHIPEIHDQMQFNILLRMA